MPSRPGPGTRRRGRRRLPPPRHSDAVLHHLEAILSLAGARRRRSGSGEAGSALQRRRQQRLALLRTVLDPLPPDLRPQAGGAERFWRALRWGGAGLLLALWLTR